MLYIVLLEAIDVIKKQKPLSPLVASVPIEKACKDHVKDLGTNGRYDHSAHEGSDGSTVADRIEKYCVVRGCGENIVSRPLNS
jgi:uncharacterized protein YkwD